VDALPVDELALRSGVPVESIQEFVEAGLLVAEEAETFSEPDVARVRLVESLLEAGLGLEQLSEAVRDGRLSFSWVGLLMPDPVRLVAVADERDPRLAFEDEVQAMLGTERRPDGLVREDDLAILGVVAEAVQLGAPVDRVVGIIRSIARAAARLTELQRDWVDEELLAPAIERTGSPIAALQETSAVRLRYRQIGREVVGLLMDRLVDDAIFRNLVELTEMALSDVGIHPTRLDQTIVFVDISNYTQLAEECGDAESARQATRLTSFTDRLARQHGGRLVKSLGDGAMMYAPTQRSGLATALEAVSTAESVGLWPLHAGVNSGPMVRRDGDLFGATVNVASRVADAAGPGQVIVTAAVVSAAADDDATRFIPLGERELKHVADPVPLYLAEARPPMGSGDDAGGGPAQGA
jgi:adenylate cyclase